MVSAILDRARALPDLSQVQLAMAKTRQTARTSFGFCGFGIERQALMVNGEYIEEEHMVLFMQPTGKMEAENDYAASAFFF